MIGKESLCTGFKVLNTNAKPLLFSEQYNTDTILVAMVFETDSLKKKEKENHLYKLVWSVIHTGTQGLGVLTPYDAGFMSERCYRSHHPVPAIFNP